LNFKDLRTNETQTLSTRATTNPLQQGRNKKGRGVKKGKTGPGKKGHREQSSYKKKPTSVATKFGLTPKLCLPGKKRKRRTHPRSPVGGRGGPNNPNPPVGGGGVDGGKLAKQNGKDGNGEGRGDPDTETPAPSRRSKGKRGVKEKGDGAAQTKKRNRSELSSWKKKKLKKRIEKLVSPRGFKKRKVITFPAGVSRLRRKPGNVKRKSIKANGKRQGGGKGEENLRPARVGQRSLLGGGIKKTKSRETEFIRAYGGSGTDQSFQSTNSGTPEEGKKKVC